MTAIVGVLNKHAIAVAADSAETVGGGLKIYDKANKIFTLSKHHPVGIAIYNNAAFNSLIPWEIIIKMYRRQLGEKPFDTVKEYSDDFFSYLRKYQSDYLTQSDFDSITSEEIRGFWIMEVVEKLPNRIANSADISPADLGELETLLSSFKTRAVLSPKIPELASVSLSQFKSSIKPFLEPVVAQIVKVGGDSDKFNTLITESLFEVFSRQCVDRHMYSGLAFFGYGELEIYPSLIEVLVYNSFAGELYFSEKASKQVNNQSPIAHIHPMAQTDVMQTYIEGISPQIEQTFLNTTEDTVKNVLSAIAKAFKSNPVLANSIANIDLSPFMGTYQRIIKQFKINNAIAPLMGTVATMEKEDLAELAENLIYLTSLKRRITPNLESVGGPVDVVIVSKGDGFIWLKRKHYFDPKLNRTYFEKYFKS